MGSTEGLNELYMCFWACGFADVCINSAESTLPCKDDEIFNTNICGFRYSTITMDHVWRTQISEKTVVLSLPEHPDTSEIRLTFFFCACSFSEALEGRRLNIFSLSGPKISPGLKAVRERHRLRSASVVVTVGTVGLKKHV